MPTRVLLPSFLAAAVACGAVAVASCSSVTNQRIGIEAPPFTEQSFKPVGDYLVHRCGTIDCHGQPGRNLRMWGCDGMRLDAGQGVNCTADDAGGGRSTVYEYQATYRSLVGLEPQVMSTVFQGCNGQFTDAGADYPPPSQCHPELLTFMQKARGIEAHKGGQLICLGAPCPPGIPTPNPNGSPPVYDPQDVCLVSWLEGDTATLQCDNAQTIGTPPADASTE